MVKSTLDTIERLKVNLEQLFNGKYRFKNPSPFTNFQHITTELSNSKVQ